jgi:hypothetical protein
MKKIFFTIFMVAAALCTQAQTQIITTGNNVVNTANPLAADVVIGSNGNSGIRHDGSMMWWSNASASRISNTADVFYLSVWNTTTANIALAAGVGGTSYFQGNILIGKTSQTNSAYKLDVAGNVRANQVVVNTTGADFVFEPAYYLYPLSMLEKYVKQNHHLPGIPSAQEMHNNGLDIGENQTILLQKVEELTLYLIEKEKEKQDQLAVNSQLEQKLADQQSQIDLLSSQLAALKKQVKAKLNK